MKFAGVIFIALGFFIGLFPLLMILNSHTGTGLLGAAALSVGLIVGGVMLCRTRVDHKKHAKSNNVMRAAFYLFVAVPMAAVPIVLVPTFIASWLLPPGQAEWVALGLAILVLPFFIWMWWVWVKMLFSSRYREVVFVNEDDVLAFKGAKPLAAIAGSRHIKTSERKDGTSKAKWKLAGTRHQPLERSQGRRLDHGQYTECRLGAGTDSQGRVCGENDRHDSANFW